MGKDGASRETAECASQLGGQLLRVGTLPDRNRPHNATFRRDLNTGAVVEDTSMLHHVLHAIVAALMAIGTRHAPAMSGSSPQLAVDTRGTVRMIYGRADTIFATTSTDQGRNFAKPVVVGVVADMHLGNTRGPVIASSLSRTLIAAADKAGNIHLFELNHATGTWKRLAHTLNDKPMMAPEGLITLAADDADHFYATWLDVRIQGHNQIFFAKTTTPTSNSPWTANVRVNTAALGGACECCRPSVAVANNNVAIMFRNNLDGSRDMYLTTSADRGLTFTAPQRLGRGTWKIDACPMDGGAVKVSPAGEISTLWRRENTLYTARPGAPEVSIGVGRSPMFSMGPNGAWMIWQDRDKIRLKTPAGAESNIGEGRLPQVLALPDGHAVAAWDQGGEVHALRIE